MYGGQGRDGGIDRMCREDLICGIVWEELGRWRGFGGLMNDMWGWAGSLGRGRMGDGRHGWDEEVGGTDWMGMSGRGGL
jgi:hypothetical protein